MSPEMAAKFGELEKTWGLPEGTLAPMGRIESSFNPRAANGSHLGMFQMGKAERAKYGVNDPYDWVQSATGAARLAADNAKYLAAHGIAITPASLYMAHQQGAKGATLLYMNPDKPAGELLPSQNITGNFGDARSPARIFTTYWGGKVGGAAPTVTQVAQVAAAQKGPLATPTSPRQAGYQVAPAAGGDLNTGVPSGPLGGVVQMASTFGGGGGGGFQMAPAQVPQHAPSFQMPQAPSPGAADAARMQRIKAALAQMVNPPEGFA